MQHWGCEPLHLLPPEMYSGGRPLSRQILKRLADLSTLVSATEGRQILLSEIQERARPGRQPSRRSYQGFLTLGDVDQAVTVAETKQNKKVTGIKRKRATPDGTFVSQGTPQNTQDTQDTPCRETATVKQPAFDDSATARLALVPIHSSLHVGETSGSTTHCEKHNVRVNHVSDPELASEPVVDHVTSDRNSVMELAVTHDINEEPQHSVIQVCSDGLRSLDQAQISPPPLNQKATAMQIQKTDHTAYSRPVTTRDGQHGPLDTAHGFGSDGDGSDISIEIGRHAEPLKEDLSTVLEEEESFEYDDSGPIFREDGSLLLSQSPPLQQRSLVEDRRYQQAMRSSSVVSVLSSPEIQNKNHSQALATLEPGQRLSSEVIYQVLNACAPSDCHVVDPLFIDPQFGSIQTRRVKNKLGTGISIVVVPLHDRKHQHWTLVVLRRPDSSAFHFDSYRSLGTAIDLEAFHRCMKELDGQYESKDLIVAKCPQQANGFDCGVQVIANALCQMTGIQTPITHNCRAWRFICRALTSHNVATVTRATVIPDQALDNVDSLSSFLGDKALNENDEKRHQRARNILAKLRSERAQMLSEKGEVVQIGTVLTKLLQSNGQTIASLNSELKAVSVSAEALCKDIETGDKQYSPLILKYSLPDHRPALRKTLEAVKTLECQLQRRLQSRQNSTSKLNAAQMTFDTLKDIYSEIHTETQLQLDQDRATLEKTARAWREEAAVKAERAQRTLAMFEETT